MLLQTRKKSKGKFDYHKTSLLLLLNRAISDFLAGLTNILIKIIFYLLSYRLIGFTDTLIAVYGSLIFFFSRISLLTSVLNLMAMTYERYMVIRNPLASGTKWYELHIRLVNVFIWVTSISFVSLHYYLYVFKLSESDGLKYEFTIFSAVILPVSVAFCCCYLYTVAKKDTQIGKRKKKL